MAQENGVPKDTNEALTLECEHCGKEYTLQGDELDGLSTEETWDVTSFCSIECEQEHEEMQVDDDVPPDDYEDDDEDEYEDLSDDTDDDDEDEYEEDDDLDDE